VDDLPLELLGSVLQGGQDVAAAAGAVVAGGHTITSTEPIYGMVALGFAEADRLLRNSTGRPGERLFLTKPIGLGMITTAIKRGKASASQAEAAVRTMTTLNAAAASAALAAGARTATDVTGSGCSATFGSSSRRPVSPPGSTHPRCPCWRACSTSRAPGSSPVGRGATTPG
jgi:selenide,water dikinase